jgi:hypothetical protein
MENNFEGYRISELILKHFRGETSLQEEAELREWMLKDKKNKLFLESFDDDISFQNEFEFFKSVDVSSAWNIVEKETTKSNNRFFSGITVWKYAAIITIILISGIGFIYLKSTENPALLTENSAQVIENNDVAPGGDKARLELADGSVIFLDQIEDGSLKSDKGIQITKQKGQLIYAVSSGTSNNITNNKISTPKGGQYQVVLQDGSNVWLNAGSSLRFPTAFLDAERIVELSGEAYFEIARNKDQPFKVKVGDIDVEVLGTHFNVMAYKDEKTINTTLIEGSVKVSKGGLSKTIVPGQQARVQDEIELANVNIEEAVAWKNGLFQFNNTSLEIIMRQLERWYDVNVSYENIPSTYFTGSISRDNNISKVLNMLDLTSDLTFKIEGKVIIVK